ncbi:MAG: DUF2085 domain-containing protein [Anaerolineae bacterium]|nr:DUF2085 domain-containing protein [Anaerolineae bacterium]
MKFSLPPGYYTTIHFLLSGICHQLPSHSLYLQGHPLPLCARCTGTYLGLVLTFLLLRLWPRASQPIAHAPYSGTCWHLDKHLGPGWPEFLGAGMATSPPSLSTNKSPSSLHRARLRTCTRHTALSYLSCRALAPS